MYELKRRRSLKSGLDRTLEKNALYLSGLFFVTTLLSQVAGDTILKNAIQPGALGSQFRSAFTSASMSQVAPLATSLSTGVAAGLGAVVWGLSIFLTIGTIRAFLKDERDSLSVSSFTDNVGWIFLNVLIGGIVFVLAVLAGFVAFVIPSFFIISSLYFWSFYVVDKEMNFVEGMKAAWSDSEGDRLMTLLLLLVVFIAVGVFGAVTGGILGAIGGMVSGTAVASALGMIPGSVATVFSWAAFTEAYRQISSGG